MSAVQGYGWLMVGAVLGLAIAATAITGWPALPVELAAASLVSRMAVGILVFAAFCALHFRAHWVATLAEIARRSRCQADGHARLVRALQDSSRSLYIICDNLREIDPGRLSPSERLYLDGAAEHARKLQSAIDRAGSAGDQIIGRSQPPKQSS